MMKKTLSILSLCIALFAALALVGCGGSASGGGSAPKSESKEKAPVAKKTDYIWLRSRCPRRRRKRLCRQECRQGPAHLPRRRERLGRSLYPRLEKSADGRGIPRRPGGKEGGYVPVEGWRVRRV